MKRRIALGAILMLGLSVPAMARDMTFGFMGKSADDSNFIVAFHGFQDEAQKNGDHAIDIGAKGPEHFRNQSEALSKGLAQHLDGIALSVTNSDWLASVIMPKISAKRIAVVTFDSDFAAKDRHFRGSFIGPDNIEIGRDLGKLAKQFLPHGGTVWLMTGGQHAARQNPNLTDRLVGVRRELSGDNAYPENSSLHGDAGWIEPNGSPWYTDDDAKVALRQTEITMKDPSVGALISVGHWPVMDANSFRQTLAPILSDNPAKKRIVIVAVGAVTPEKQALLRDNLIQGYVSIDFDRMGRLAYQILSKLATGQKVPDRVTQKNVTITAIKDN